MVDCCTGFIVGAEPTLVCRGCYKMLVIFSRRIRFSRSISVYRSIKGVWRLGISYANGGYLQVARCVWVWSGDACILSALEYCMWVSFHEDGADESRVTFHSTSCSAVC
jgi:hypothetical protein